MNHDTFIIPLVTNSFYTKNEVNNINAYSHYYW